MNTRFSFLLALSAAVAILSGCATSRDVVTIQVPTTTNPTTGQAVKIESVKDARQFEAKPSDPSVPSLMGGEIGDADLRARAIARKRNGYGAALGDVLLPENTSVAQMTEQAIARAYREAGYRVVSVGDPEHAAALPVSAQIDKLWAWMQPGFWAVKVSSQHNIKLTSPTLTQQGSETLTGSTEQSMQVVVSDDWAKAIQRTLDEFALNLKTRLQRR